MNSLVRSWAQRRYEAPLLERLGGRTPSQRVLEVGCGCGVGVEIIFERFGAQEVYAFDIDPGMVERARRRLSAYSPERLQLTIGDVCAINAYGESFDAVFDFGVLHHVPNWQAAVSEIHRVLRPSGRFFFEEVTRDSLNRWIYRTFLKHPTENRFSTGEFVAELERQGIAVGGNFIERSDGDIFFGVGRRG